MTVGIRQIIEHYHFIPHRVYPGGSRAFAPLATIHRSTGAKAVKPPTQGRGRLKQQGASRWRLPCFC